jgi:pimeloyl-ACP methyl ester carboxylesterase
VNSKRCESVGTSSLPKIANPSRARTNLLRGPADWAYIASFLAQRTSGPVVLVGHSYGGFVITNAVNGASDVKALVYVDAFAPDEGETTFQILGGSGSAFDIPDPTTVFDIAAYPGGPDGDAEAFLKPDTVHNSFAQDLPEADRWLKVRASGRSSDPAGHATPHGRTRRGHGHRGGWLACLDGVTPPGDDRRDPRGGRR